MCVLHDPLSRAESNAEDNISNLGQNQS